MPRQDIISELLGSACPSIQYRIRREILLQPVSAKSLQDLHAQILQDEAVKAIIASQSPDGWLGGRFHGYDSMEASIRLLCEKGISPRQPALAGALQALEAHPDRILRQMGNAGRILDERGFGGTYMIMAAILAYAALEQKVLVQEQIGIALEGFRAVLSVASIDDIVEHSKAGLVFKPGVQWPGIYHLRLLAFTHNWRSVQNHQMIVEAIRRMIELSPLPEIHVKHKSQLIAPASFAMQDFNPNFASMDAAQWMAWFHRTELLSRLEVIKAIPELLSQVILLQEMCADTGGRFTRQISHSYFKHWGAYTGLMLERDWRTVQRRISDLTFRCLLIQHYSAI